ncbi:zinc-dependent metalloprotease [Psychroserpens sp. SPM9]|uniref:zinc-dependent metalloprotease n=1 Tax=Psychroserpens sp. SPM9 TaxID=2975598 RepID=UPI0021A6574E|nr:zinc-dependent metalloprotease [Psychroserpens sp. SPM9]MDG5491812.1 zinc-dependent metalloprotease [Psychroserpens sp. SPM9]
MFQNCSKDTLEPEKEQLKITPVVEQLTRMGFDIDNIKETKNSYIVEGDLVFSKNIEDYNNYSDNFERQAHSDNTVGLNGTTPRIINVYSKITDPGGVISQDPNPWLIPITNAISDWNTVIDDSCLQFVLVNHAQNADIKIISDMDPESPDVLPSNYLGRAGLPDSNMDPFGYVYINLDFTNTDTSPPSNNQMRNIIIHEIGHCVGFVHTDQSSSTGGYNPIPGTPINDPNSVMNAFIVGQNSLGFSNYDAVAVDYLYGGCTNIIINPITSINGPAQLCSGQATYTLTGATVADWHVSTNLNIVSENGNTVTVELAHNGAVIGGTYVEAQLSNGDLVRRNISTGSPTPSGSAVISGPNLLKYYQTGAFSTSSSNFSSYTNVEWVVFSYSFPNAGQYFDIRQNYNNDFFTEVEVLPTAPEGFYTVQCRVSNNCGTFYIDKQFEVKKARPQFYDVLD